MQLEKDDLQAAKEFSGSKDDLEFVKTNSHESKSTSLEKSIKPEGSGFRSISGLWCNLYSIFVLSKSYQMFNSLLYSFKIIALFYLCV